MEEVLGLDETELYENMDLNLFECGLVDSLAIVSLITEVEKDIGCKIVIKNIHPKDLLTINRLIAAIDKQRYSVDSCA